MEAKRERGGCCDLEREVLQCLVAKIHRFVRVVCFVLREDLVGSEGWILIFDFDFDWSFEESVNNAWLRSEKLGEISCYTCRRRMNCLMVALARNEFSCKYMFFFFFL